MPKRKGEAKNTWTDSLSILEEEELISQPCEKRRLEITLSESIIQYSVSSNDIYSSQQPSCFQHQEDSSQFRFKLSVYLTRKIPEDRIRRNASRR